MAFNLFSSPALVVNKNNTQEALKQQMKPVAPQPPKGEGGAEVSGSVAPAWTQYGSATTTPNRMYRGTIDPTSATSGMDAVNAMLTTPAEEERLRKASVANQRIMAIGDALRHIGNIYHTVRYAPSQKLSSPVQDEVARYERGKALRDAANLRYYSYQQQKAAQDAKQRQWEAEYGLKVADAARKAGYTEAQIKNMQERLKAQKENWAATLGLRKSLGEAAQKERERHNKVSEGQGHQRIVIADRNSRNAESHRQWIRQNKGGGSGSGGAAPLDTPQGQVIPNARNYSNQLLQGFDFARSKGLVKESDVAKRLRELGYGKDQSDNVKRQMVMDLLRTNPDMGDYFVNRLGWQRGAYNPASTPQPASYSNYIAPGNTWGQTAWNPQSATPDYQGDYESDDIDDYDLDDFLME